MLPLVRGLALRLVRNDLPVGLPRLALTVLLEVLAIVTGGLCLKIWTKHHKWQTLLNEHLPPGVSASLEYNDLKMTSICMFVATHVATFVASHTVLLMLHDLYHFLPKIVLRRLPRTSEPLSTYTLPHQTAALLFAVACVLIAGAFHINVVFNRVGLVVSTEDVSALLDELGIDLPYRDAYYMRISAIMAVPTMVVGVAALVVTAVGWAKRQRPSITTEESSSIEEK